MNYEKAYKEARDRAKKLKEISQKAAVQNACDYIFPELKETDDQKMRKEIVNFLRREQDYLQESRLAEPCSPQYRFIIDAIAWLEKQGE